MTGITEWPLPNRYTRPPLPMQLAKRSPARSSTVRSVVWMRSRMRVTRS